MKNSQRGSALITAIVVLLVVTVIGIGIIRFSARELAGASATAHEQALVACAEAARQQLMSQFHAIGFNPASLTALNVPLGTSTGVAQARAMGGHYDASMSNVSNVVLSQVTLLPAAAFGPTRSVRDITNIVVPGGGGVGQPLKVVVHCQEGTIGGGRQLEVELGVRFGL
jgi:xanthine/uracil permease